MEPKLRLARAARSSAIAEPVPPMSPHRWAASLVRQEPIVDVGNVPSGAILRGRSLPLFTPALSSAVLRRLFVLSSTAAPVATLLGVALAARLHSQPGVPLYPDSYEFLRALQARITAGGPARGHLLQRRSVVTSAHVRQHGSTPGPRQHTPAAVGG